MFKEMPKEYNLEANHKGIIEKVEYEFKGYQKHVNVYLPYNYDENKQYNTFYLMHGGGQDADRWFRDTTLKNILDNLIERKECEPLIVITPTYYTYPKDTKEERDHVLLFQRELIYTILPLIERKYSCKKTREGRAFGGYSMGCVNTWCTFIDHLDYFKYFMPMSGDCWEYGVMGGLHEARRTAKCLANTVRICEYSANDIFVYGSVGKKGIAYEPFMAQAKEMLQIKDIFNKNNFIVDIAEDGIHDSTIYGIQYIYNALPNFFK